MFLKFNLLKNFLLNKRLIKSIYILILLVLFIILYLYVKEKNKKLKRKFDSIPLYFQNIINNYISDIPQKYKYEKEQEKYKLVSLLSLNNFSNVSNIEIKSELKLKLLKELQTKDQNKNLSQIKGVYIKDSFRYGNSIVLLNNLLYYCEILNITNIYLNSKKSWPIIENITTNEINITLLTDKNIDLKDKSITSFNKNYIYFQKIIKPEIRIDRLKYEIKRNLPKVILNQKDLFIHIRSGDIFEYKSNNCINYAQPPLCFYQSILKSFKFRKIFIIAQNSLNPIINLLIQIFPGITMTNNSLEEDVSLLMNAYNIVGSISSLFTTTIIFNENLKNVWEYDLYRLPEKYFHLHHDIYNYKIKYSIYKMIPSEKYKKMMIPWINSRQQRELMIHEKCKDFKLVATKEK